MKDTAAAAAMPSRMNRWSPAEAIIMMVMTEPGELTPTRPTLNSEKTAVPVMPPAMAAMTSAGRMRMNGK